MRSMTGFGTATTTGPAGSATVQVASVNHKSLAVHLRSDLRDLGLDERLRAVVRGRVVRGSLTVAVTWTAARSAGIDGERLRAVWRELADHAQALGAPPPTLDTALACLGHQRGDEVSPAADLIEAALAQALDALEGDRRREGGALLADLQAKGAALRGVHARLPDLAAARLPRQRQALKDRLQEALQGAAPISEEVLAREMAIQVDRLDVGEEIIRLGAHLDALDALLVKDEPIGRQLDFLCQEIGREINTTGSKSNDVALTAEVLQAKNLLEQMKEQIANVE